MKTLQMDTLSPDQTDYLRRISASIDSLYSLMTSYDGDNGGTFDQEFHRRLKTIHDASCDCLPTVREALMKYCFEKTAPELDTSNIHRRGRQKPLGYAGDFLSIDWTYQKLSDSPGRGRLWDEFYHRQDAPLAVCARKDLFGDIIEDIVATDTSRSCRVLNVASGPGREIRDALVRHSSLKDMITVDCLDNSADALAYSKTLIGPVLSQSVNFHCGNAILFRPQTPYDFVWCAGLFDYLQDRLAVSLLKRLWNAVDRGGRLVIGNFAETHRTRPYIEWCGNWFLIHRSKQEMQALADQAGIPANLVAHHVDEWGAIRYLTAVRPD
ncbi:MAG: class I SAM-dependent methyltransferase [Planctomycetaceae bacterium]|nr:class I SAM-dependent methyltransferase [Planctomycetaceae bacterium]